ncbi:MAG: DUF937 domain-containing protein [Thiobacillus sp.]|uniref:DUF937 domain-containing protein n=1 Tax=Thiobacillus sp. TaxID=924 RepID=UPI002895F68A|nr:DUF937 domain-containing protein [Thiobacillus sp.]MDT3706677.1 DUF937 domain-containing protein [Thiobacillus sp.]
MQITDILAQMGGLQFMARELGVSETQAASGAEALIPAILGGFKKQAQAQPTGLEGLGGLLGGRSAEPVRSGASGLVSMLDLNSDGNPLDDIMRMAGVAMR